MIPRQNISKAARRLATLAAFLVLASCDSMSEGETQARADREIYGNLSQQSLDAAQDCLMVVWDRQEQPNREFDRANDNVEGGAISCATGTSASEFEAALTAIRAAAAANDRAALMRELGVPLLYIDSGGERREVREDELYEASFDEVFSDEMIALMQDLQLEDMTVVPDQGAFFELGSVWLVADSKGARPRLVTVNRQALEEAAAAARQEGQVGA